MSRLSEWISGFAAAAAVVAGGASPAMAAVTVTPGNHPADAVNVVANSCVGVPVAAPHQVFGCLETDPGRLVSIVSNEDVVYTGGQASIAAADGSFATFAVSMVDGTDMLRSVVNIGVVGDVANGYVRFSAGGVDSDWFLLNGSGQNFFTLVGDPGYGSFTATTALLMGPGDYRESQIMESASQLRIATAVPEPESVALMLAGLGVLGATVRRRRR